LGRERDIAAVTILNVLFTIIEIVGGLLTNSLAILADALHDSGDSIALLSSWYLERRAKRPPDAVRTFGYKRLSLFAALFSALVLVGGSIFILIEAVGRLRNPEGVNAEGMMVFAILGIVFNTVGFLRLHRGHAINDRVLSWHLLEDVLGWFAILAGGTIIRLTGSSTIDPILTIGFTFFVLWGVGRNLREVFNVLLEGVPSHINVGKVKESLLAIDGVLGVHDVHIWSMEGETDFFTGHIIVEDELLLKPDRTRRTIKEVLRNHHIEHSTTELESKEFCSGIECGLNITEKR